MSYRVLVASMWLVCAACTERAGGPAPAVTGSVRERQMNVANEFNALATEWAQHCDRVSFSSKISSYLDHPSYRSIVALGEPAIPLIVERYRQDDLPWGFALQEITGVKMIEDPGSFKPKEVKRRWLEWWDERQKTTGGAAQR
jgi:hypothetical protein